MKDPAEDLENRRPVWDALSTLFLDTDTALLGDYRVSKLASSPYSIEELTEILTFEVCPVCWWNLLSVAGVWDGFDLDWLEGRILRRLRSPFSRFLGRWTPGRFTVPLSSEWRETLVAVRKARRGSPPASRVG